MKTWMLAGLLALFSLVVTTSPASAAVANPGHCVAVVNDPYSATDPFFGYPSVEFISQVVCNGSTYNTKSAEQCWSFNGTSNGFAQDDYVREAYPNAVCSSVSMDACPKVGQCSHTYTPGRDCDFAYVQGVGGQLDWYETWKNGTVHHYTLLTTSTPIFGCQW